MSYQTMGVVMELTEQLTPTEFAVLMALAHHQNTTSGLCTPSYETISQYARCGRSTTAKILGVLRERGLIYWITRNRGTESAYNEYRFTLNRVQTESRPSPKQVQTESEASPKVSPDGWTVTGYNRVTGQQSNKEKTAVAVQITPQVETEKVMKKEDLPMVNDPFTVCSVIERWNDFIKEYPCLAKHPQSIRKGFREGMLRLEKVPLLYRRIALFQQSEGWEDDFDEVLEAIRNSPYLQTGTSKWTLTLNWIFSPGKIEGSEEEIENRGMELIRSGKYAGGTPEPPAPREKMDISTMSKEEYRKVMKERFAKLGTKNG